MIRPETASGGIGPFLVARAYGPSLVFEVLPITAHLPAGVTIV